MGWIYQEAGAGKAFGMYLCQEFNRGGLVQAFSTKSAGNMALHTGDAPQAVIKRRQAFLECFGLTLSQMTAAQQTHGVNIQVVDETAAGKGAQDAGDAFPDTDALLTKVPGIVLTIFTADCLPLFIYDPKTPAVGIIHAGWRGAIAGIVPRTLAKMRDVFGTDPKECRVALGPGIGPECFQVSAELAIRFQESCPASLLKSQDRFGVDLTEFNKQLLLEAGVPSQRIFPSGQCTCCRPGTFFSYRASGAAGGSGACMGRMMGLIALR